MYDARRRTCEYQYVPVNVLYPLFVCIGACLYFRWPESIVFSYSVSIGHVILLAPVFCCTMALVLRVISPPNSAPGALTGSFQALTNCRVCHSREVHEDEWRACESRRHSAQVQLAQRYCALSLPGGGIRQSNFSTGVILYLVSEPELNVRPLWRHIDFISAVSGGGYAANSIVSHLIEPDGNDFDDYSRNAAVRSAELLQTYANWPLERNWPACLDDLMKNVPCIVTTAYNIFFLVALGTVQFVTPFVLLWSISVMLIPVTLFMTIDMPEHIFRFSTACTNWSGWWLSSEHEPPRKTFLFWAAVVLVCLRIMRLVIGSQARKVQAKVNQFKYSTEDEKEALIVKHARVVTTTHLARALFNLGAVAWLFAAAYVASGFNCGTFFRSHRQSLDLSILGSVALLIIMSQAQDASFVELPAAFMFVGAAVLYSIACVHFDAWLLGTRCELDCKGRTLFGGRFFQRKYFYRAVLLWCVQPAVHNLWSFLLPRWYAGKLSRFLKDPSMTLGDLRNSAAHAPYLLMCSTIHHVWKLPRGGPGSALQQLGSSTFIMSPLHVGDDTIGFVGTDSRPHSNLRLCGAAAISGAATSNVIMERTTHIHHVLTFFSGLLFGYWYQFEPNEMHTVSLRSVTASMAVALLHFAGSMALLLAYEECSPEGRAGKDTGDDAASPTWKCTKDGRLFVVAGFCFIVLEVCIVPVFLTWAKSIWRAPFFGKWFSEWMQLQGFSFPHSAASANGLPRHVYLSDGGHMDNLGLLEPLRRRSCLIICPHSGFTLDHAMQNLSNAMRRAREDPSIRASFVPLAWNGARLVEVEGNVEKAQAEFSLDMEKNCFVVGINYAKYQDGVVEAPAPLGNTWGVLILLVSRPPDAETCKMWGVKAAGETALSDVDSGLQAWERFCRSSRGGRIATADLEPRIKSFYKHIGGSICCRCCHRFPRRLVAPLGRFPNHKTAVQCLTPESAEAYQGLGFATASMNAKLLTHAMQLLAEDEKRPW